MMIYLKNEDVVLFQGDSITHGGRGENQRDLNHVMGHGYQEMLAGRLALENVDTAPTFINRGVSGDRTVDLLNRWDADTIAIKPTVLSILIGVNDCLIPQNGADRAYSKNLTALLNRTKEALPDVKLILCEPFAFLPSDISSDEERSFHQKRIDLVRSCSVHAELTAKQFDAVFVPFWFALKQQEKRRPAGSVIWDGIHPTTLGHAILAECWYNTVQKAEILRK